jgi:6-pyruvoyltetrahydropterin/6-carboxytetrahydropterin synthase
MFQVVLSKERFKFSSSHFTLFSEDQAESLHGHNYQVEVRVDFKKLNPESGLAAEFHSLKKTIDDCLLSLDEKILLPSLSPYLDIGETETNIEVKFHDKFYSFPKQDCLVMEIVNTSSECLSQWLFEELKEPMLQLGAMHMSVSIFETPGQGVTYQEKF